MPLLGLGVVAGFLGFETRTVGAGGRPASCAEAATMAGKVSVGLVVDFGSLPGAPGTDVGACASVDNAANGYAVLQAAGRQIRLDTSGLVCAIDGYPAGDDCGTRSPTGYRYWAYFYGDGSGGWTYASIGPGGHRVFAGSVEGWHFVEGAGKPIDPPPAGSSDHASLCGSAPPPTTASTTPPVTAPPAPPLTAPPSPGAPAPTVTLPGGAPAPVPTTASTTSPAGGALPAGNGVAPTGTNPDGSPNAPQNRTATVDGTGPTGSDLAGGTAGDDGSARSGDGDEDGDKDGGEQSIDAINAVPAVAVPSATGGVPWVALLFVVALIALAGWRFRSRPSP